MSKIIGIDLGTTNSVVSIMEGGSPAIIPTAEGGNLCPSIAAFSKQGERLVGQPAKRQAVINPENSIYSIKRLIGRRFEDAETQRTIEMVPYEVVSGPSGDARVRVPINKKTYTPQEISAFILQKLKKDAEDYLGEKVTKAVITVPAYFNDSQRQATKDAGKIAGLEVLRIINEPTAAALAYGLGDMKNEAILVFDLGGGTFDVSILEVGEGVFEVKSTNGDTHLGGDDWDEKIVDWLVESFRNAQGVDLSKDNQALQRLRDAAEKAKIELSSMMETEINLPYITADANGPKHLLEKLSRAKFEQLTEDLVQRCRQPFNAALKDAGLALADINEVILVGGSTRMPMIQELVQSLTNKAPNKTVNPDEVVAMGAAIQGGVLAGDVKDILLVDVTPLSLGLETMGSVMTRLIERNTAVPTRKTEVFSTAEDSQTAVDIHILQGERPMAGDNKTLGNFRLDGIPAAPRGLPQIEVTFDIDANGILDVTAKDKATGKEQKIQITASTNLSSNEVDRMVDEARQHEAEDKQRRELVEARNSADQLIYATEKTIKELGDKAPAAERGQVESLISDLKAAVEGDDTASIRALTEQLQQASNAFSQQLNQQQEVNQPGDNGNNGHGGGQSPEAHDEPAIDGEFVEM